MAATLQLAICLAVVVLGFVSSSAVASAGTPTPRQRVLEIAQPPQTPLEHRLAAALAGSHIPASRNAAVVIDLESGVTVFSQSRYAGLIPASNEKLPLTFAALTLFGPKYRIETDALGEGTRRGGTWVGDLVLKGFGDPSLSSAGLRLLARRVRAHGIRTIAGDLVADESFFDARRDAPGWKSYFLGEECAPLSALSVNRGRDTSALPPVVADRIFLEALSNAGVHVIGTLRVGAASADALPLASLRSPPLSELLRFMDHESDNYTAELLLKQVGTFDAFQGTTANGAATVTDVLRVAGVPLANVRIVDGSGLSQLDRLTPAALAAVLQSVWSYPQFRAPFLSSLAVAGESGTLSHRMRLRPARGNVYAKTGTTEFASALSGYVRKSYAFAILQNGSPVPTGAARASQDRFAALLAAQ